MSLLRRHLPQVKVRLVNVVDIMRLQTSASTRTASRTASSTASSPRDKPVIFAYHGYPWLIHRLTYRRTNHAEHPRARLQGGGHHHHAVRHGDAQRPRPLPPGDRRDRPGAGAGGAPTPACASTWWTSGCAAGSTPGSTARTPRTWPTGSGRAERMTTRRWRRARMSPRAWTLHPVGRLSPGACGLPGPQGECGCSYRASASGKAAEGPV